jgi:hypothetical protein
MKILLTIGVVLCLVGLVWLGQGIGLIGGSFMTGEALWAVIGAIALVMGAGFLRAGVRMRGVDDGDGYDE